VKVRDVAVAVPATRVDSATIAEWTGADPVFIADKIGIKSRAFLADGETVASLAAAACHQLFTNNPALRRDEIGLVILVTQNPDFKLPHTSALLQHELKLTTETACFDVNLGCSGYVYALTAAKAFMASEEIRNALVVTCDPYSRIMGKSDRDTVTIFVDAASATWLSSESGATIGLLDFGTDGSGADSLIVKAGGAAHPLTSIWSDTPPACAPEDLRLKMNGRAIFNFMMARVPISVKRCLERNRLSMADIDYFVFHQASKFMVENLRRALKVDAEKAPCDLTDVGNTVSSSIPMLLSHLRASKRLAGARVLVSGFGVGLSWATNVLTFGEQ